MKWQVIVTARLFDESGREVTYENWDGEYEATDAHDAGLWLDVQNAVESAFHPQEKK